MKLGNKKKTEETEDVLKGLANLYTPQDQGTTPLEDSVTPIPEMQDTIAPDNQPTQVVDSHTTQVVEDHATVVPRSHITMTPDNSNTAVTEDQAARLVEHHDIQPLEDRSTVVPQQPETQQPQSYDLVISEPPATTVPELQSGKRPGWKQMTIWVPVALEPAMKLLSQFEGESISEMSRTYFQNRIDTSPFSDLIKDTLKKRAKIKKKR